MSVYTSKNAELFFKALEDVWVAEQTWNGSPSNAVWHCTQAAEKTMKGFLRCLNMDYDYGHELEQLLEEVLTVFEVSAETSGYVLFLDTYRLALRYKNMANDPSPEDAKIAISRTKMIMQEFNNNHKAAQFMNEANEAHTKMLRANSEKYPDAD